jgi:hypothetical protein
LEYKERSWDYIMNRLCDYVIHIAQLGFCQSHILKIRVAQIYALANAR